MAAASINPRMSYRPARLAGDAAGALEVLRYGRRVFGDGMAAATWLSDAIQTNRLPAEDWFMVAAGPTGVTGVLTFRAAGTPRIPAVRLTALVVDRRSGPAVALGLLAGCTQLFAEGTAGRGYLVIDLAADDRPATALLRTIGWVEIENAPGRLVRWAASED